MSNLKRLDTPSSTQWARITSEINQHISSLFRWTTLPFSLWNLSACIRMSFQSRSTWYSISCTAQHLHSRWGRHDAIDRLAHFFRRCVYAIDPLISPRKDGRQQVMSTHIWATFFSRRTRRRVYAPVNCHEVDTLYCISADKEGATFQGSQHSPLCRHNCRYS